MTQIIPTSTSTYSDLTLVSRDLFASIFPYLCVVIGIIFTSYLIYKLKDIFGTMEKPTMYTGENDHVRGGVNYTEKIPRDIKKVSSRQPINLIAPEYGQEYQKKSTSTKRVDFIQ
jgi:hypothetical protein